MVLDDIKKIFDALIGQLSPEKAQELAKRYLGRGADKDQVAKAAGELIDLSQRLGDGGSQGGCVADALDGRRDTGRARRAPEAGAGPGARGGHDRVRSEDRRLASRARGRRPSARKTTTSRRPPDVLERLVDGKDRVGRRRLDAELVRRGLAGSRAEAQEAVRAGT